MFSFNDCEYTPSLSSIGVAPSVVADIFLVVSLCKNMMMSSSMGKPSNSIFNTGSKQNSKTPDPGRRVNSREDLVIWVLTAQESKSVHLRNNLALFF
ncbi:hypothetical protein GOP47_0024871 [Adiantum capillus-veneris]|uniref:Uncharacterized protein n=1 Tax=Adiantum capillus-veneris TaxID=13818 RepID=A0A9D4U578_ADICA|nr:hypothetical protein GOP47_0024871 [Adiantum capillus-veneris]